MRRKLNQCCIVSEKRKLPSLVLEREQTADRAWPARAKVLENVKGGEAKS
jgi:hypothetical protein